MKRNALIVCAVALLLRLLYLGALYLLPEEAYYWRYAASLDIGYLDHPPMVAVSIYSGTMLFGLNEWGVRIMALLWWGVATYYAFRYSLAVRGERAAWGAVAMCALLPYWFAAGFFMTPDAPLLAFWAATLFYLHEATVVRNERAWWAVGIVVGFGFLSKYPLVLLGVALLVFLLLDARRRMLLLQWRPWAAALLALLIFTPVLVWNYEHEWASFAFQSADRVQKAAKFSLHLLIAHLFVVLSPVGVWVFLSWLRGSDRRAGESERFVQIFTLVPLAIFTFFSLRHEVKVNWTGPVFLAFLPVLGDSVVHHAKAWRRSALALGVLYLLSLQYLSYGFPGVGYPRGAYKFLMGDEVAAALIKIEAASATEGFVRPVVVGMDKHYLASELGFYFRKLDSAHELPAGRSLFALPSLMYYFWTKPSEYAGRDMLMVSRTRADVEDAVVEGYFDSMSEIREFQNEYHGHPAGPFYYRLAKGYHPERRN